MAPPWTQLKAEFLHEEDLREAMENLFLFTGILLMSQRQSLLIISLAEIITG